MIILTLIGRLIIGLLERKLSVIGGIGISFIMEILLELIYAILREIKVDGLEAKG